MYQLLDSGDKLKLEAFGPYKIIRPCGMAFWPRKTPSLWHEENVDAIFTREEKGRWAKHKLPDCWNIKVKGVGVRLKATDFGHLGLFPEHLSQFDFFEKSLQGRHRIKVLNLFAYSGATSIFLAQRGCFVTHVDASKPINLLAKENAMSNSLASDAIRWITDDVIKFIQREKRRENLYDAIVLDPPSFGRGSQGQVFKIEEHLHRLIEGCLSLLTKRPVFFLFTNHTPGFTPLFLQRFFSSFNNRHFKQGVVQAGEMTLESGEGSLPMGTYYRWRGNSDA